ncbi:MAG: hypothetical protein FWG44_03160 [Oscillospiraceae bacterium]|nr:hypothetical protein [Oscillospiraceae bacterium]
MVTQSNQNERALNYSGVIENFTGLSTDPKPVLKPENNGSSFFELDTKRVFFWDGDSLNWK